MNRFGKIFILFFIVCCVVACGATSNARKKGTIVLLETTMGNIKIRLYDETPIHRDNFIKLVNSGIYDDVLFHRIVQGFMIQTGDPTTKSDGAPAGFDTEATIPSEFNPSLFHKRGAVAAARYDSDINPELRSTISQFYIVQGKSYSDYRLNQIERTVNNNIRQSFFNMYMAQIADSSKNLAEPLFEAEIEMMAAMRWTEYFEANGSYTFTPEQRETYMKDGGAPSLDGTYTVFGEVIEGIDIVDKIAAIATNDDEEPMTDVRIKSAKIVKR